MADRRETRGPPSGAAACGPPAAGGGMTGRPGRAATASPGSRETGTEAGGRGRNGRPGPEPRDQRRSRETRGGGRETRNERRVPGTGGDRTGELGGRPGAGTGNGS